MVDTFNTTTLSRLVAGRPETFPHEYAIRFLQFRTWLLFPGENESEIVDAVGKLAAATVLKDHEVEQHPPRVWRLGNRKDPRSKILANLLKDDEYCRVYDVFFGRSGWTDLLDTLSFNELHKIIQDRRPELHTVCEMIDFRFRGVDHGQLTPKQADITASELHVFKLTKLSWRTVRKRWGNLKASAPFIYASEKLGYDFLPPAFADGEFKIDQTNRSKIRRFMEASVYVADKIGWKLFDDDAWMNEFKTLKPKQPQTQRLEPATLEIMGANYRADVAKMRNS
ncbi:hypothetical protein [Bradyrhizobium sp. th.b2]|uniref:hypothetical protein n=1 Tax=Bradyrhizobium sp. th-b2 TaxID=172088 RepID=UPI0012EC8CFF|nr:hypothetical protein [Bradyrhizobium sp. th.b2]